ncbi:MAG: cytochrome d ubiquinol oxidase subunit II [Ponticaulis sp.]|mgnify:CR=1 FL=1|nr:cytochrome d ubiquinol oxidase subunit II [Ponticaulis sp.]
MELPFDYATVKVIWWFLVGVLLIGYALTDGYDLGVATVLPFAAQEDSERRMVINSIGSMWEGHQVWFITAGGALFAAWPYIYEISFSGFYLAMFLVLVPLIIRAVGFKYRSKLTNPAWREAWDWGLFAGGFIPALVFGVAIGNVLQGVPFFLDENLRVSYEGGLFGLLNPFALLCGLLSVAMLVVHGTGFLMMKIERGKVMDQAAILGQIAALAAIALFAIGGIWSTLAGMGYAIQGEASTHTAANPVTYNDVAREAGAWMGNYSRYPWMILAPLFGFVGMAIAIVGLRKQSPLGFVGSSIGVTGIVGTVGTSMFPIILPSTISPEQTLTVWDSSSSHLTLTIMLFVAIVFVPLIIAYTSWVFNILWGRVTEDEVTSSPDAY